jgi:hypothetical protein
VSIGTPQAGTWTAANAGSPTNVPYPATVAANDYLILAASVQTPAGVGSITTPAGWTLVSPPGFLVSNAGTGTPGLAVYTKLAAGTEGGTNLSVAYTSGTPNFAAQILGFAGVNTGTPQDVAATSVDGAALTTCTIPGQTIATAGATQVAVSASNSTTATATPPTGFTETGDTTSFRAMEVSYINSLTTGATASRVVNWSASARTVGIMLALRPTSTISGVYLLQTGPTLVPITITQL